MLMHQWLDAAGVTDPELRRCYLAVIDRERATTSSELRTFKSSLYLVPAAVRPYVMATLTMLRIADVRADRGDPAARLRRLDEWAGAVLAAIAAGHSDDPVLHAVAHTFGVWGLRTCHLEEVFGAMRRDAVFTPFATHEELQQWARATTGGSLMLFWPMVGVAGMADEAEPQVRAVGAATQIADNLYDLADDLKNGRIYLPLEDLDRFGVTPDDLFQGRWSPAVAELLAFEVARVRGQLQVQVTAAPERWVHPAFHPCLRAWGRGYELWLDEVIDDGAMILRRVPPLRLHRWLTAILSDRTPSDALRDEVPSPRTSVSYEGLAGGLSAARRSPAAIEAELHRWVRSGGDWLGLICSDALFPSADRLGPVLCLEAALATGGGAAEILPLAAGLECIHAGSRVHEDVLDRSVTRHGRASPPHRIVLDDALLRGDGLFGYGFLAVIGAWEDGAPAERVLPALRVVARALQTMCRAALLESRLRGDLSADLGLCLEVIRGKTAAVMQAACEAGGILAGAQPAQVHALGRYGEALGMALQIRDDLLAYTGGARASEAAIASGAHNRHPTLPVLLARDLAGDADRSRLAELFPRSADSQAVHRELRDLLIRTGAGEEATQRARAYAAHARQALAELPPSVSRDRLADLVTTVVAPDGVPSPRVAGSALARPSARTPRRASNDGVCEARSPAAIEAELRGWVTGDGDPLAAICGDALFPPGKLLRPVLCLESALATGGIAGDALPFAAGLECIHVASLVHDDILDQDATRRGRPSIAHRHGVDDAIMAGDGLLSHGLLAMLGPWENGVPAERVLPALRVVARALQAECRAALLESMLRADLSIDLTLCLEVIRGKTAALLQAACESGGILAGAPPAQVHALGCYGDALGMAFQIRDDLLPYTSDARTIGKSITSDVQNRYPTLPVLLARDLASGADRRRLIELFSGSADPLVAHRELRELLDRTGAIEEATRRARQYATRARSVLAELSPSPSRDRLADLITAAVDRDR